MIDEMVILHSSGTWELVSLPPRKSSVNIRYAYTIKVGPDGRLIWLKACLVVKCYKQLSRLDYGETLTPPPQSKDCFSHGFLSMVVTHNWTLYQLSSKIFSQWCGVIYCGGRGGGDAGLYIVSNSLQAKFNTIIQELRLTRGGASHVIFYRQTAANLCIYLDVYIDDIAILGNDQDDITKLQHFQTKDLGWLKSLSPNKEFSSHYISMR